jgi:hypothetical protein
MHVFGSLDSTISVTGPVKKACSVCSLHCYYKRVGLSLTRTFPLNDLNMPQTIIDFSTPRNFDPIERTAYRRDVLKLPGPIDRWLTTNSRSPRIDFLEDYLMFSNPQGLYVVCVVEVESTVRVSTLLFSSSLNLSTVFHEQ